jgi:hypothetical protein
MHHMRYDVLTEFEVIAVATSESKGSDQRVQLHAATLIDGGRFLFRSEPALWETDLRLQLERAGVVDLDDLDAVTFCLSRGETARFKVTCTPQNLVDLGFSGVNRVY